MNGWIVRNKNIFNWISSWNIWTFNPLMVGREEEYNKDNKIKRTSIRRP